MKKPDIRSLIIIFTVVIFTPCLLSAKIPEPSNVLFGTVHISGKQILKTDTEVIVVARLANTEIASYQMGSNTVYGDQYLLKIPLDSVGNRNINSTHKNDTINIFVSNILANTITVGERGTVKESNLAVDATDTDADGMPDYWETRYYLLVTINDASDDKDLDGLTNLTEYTFGSDPTMPDSDGDGMLDLFEYTHGFNPNDPADALLDSDSDGLTNFQESQNNTNPHSADSDGDGMSDSFEVQYGLNPNDAADASLDSDGDGYTNLQEYQNGTDPTVDNSASQSQLVLLARANLFDGDISSLETDESTIFISSHNSDQVKVIDSQTTKLQSLSAMSSKGVTLENVIATNAKNGVNALVRWNHLLIIATGDNQVVVWDLNQNQKTSELMIKTDDNNTSVLSLAIDDLSLVAGAANGKIYVWHNNNGTFEFDTAWVANSNLKENYKTGFVTSVSLSTDKIFSTRLLPEKALNAWDRHNYYLILFELKGEVPCCKFPKLAHNQSSLVMSRTFSTKTLTSIPLSASTLEDAKHKEHREHDSKINIVVASTNHVISADDNGQVYIWNQSSNLLVQQFKAHDNAIRSMKIKDKYLVTGSVTGEVKIWNFPY